MTWKSKISKKLINLNSEQKIFFLFLTAFLSTLLVSNNKFYILIFLFLGLTLFFYFKKSIWETFFLTFIFSLPFENNLREWTFTVTQQLFKDVPASGYNLYFGLNIKLILATGLFFLTLFQKKQLNKIISNNDKLFLIFFLLACLNTYSLGKNSLVPILGLIRIWIAVLIFITSKLYFLKHKKIFFAFITALFIYSTIIGSLQLIYQKPLGKYIELTPSFNKEFGYSTTDGNQQYRVSGFISHPVYFASFFSILFPIYIAFSLKNKNKKKLSLKNTFKASISLIIGSLVIIGTLSRSAFLTLLISLFLLRKPIYQQILIPLSKIKKTKYLLLPIITILTISLIVYVTPRLNSIKLLFTENGNASIRLELIKKSFEIIYQNPFGVGLNNFTIELAKLNIPPSLYGFIVPVHNTFLIFFTELGIPAGIIFILFVISIFKKNFFKKKQKLTSYGIWIGMLSFLINSQIHPLFNLDPTFDLFILVSAYYSICT